MTAFPCSRYAKELPAAATEPWKFYDLCHGYCTYDFFDQCQHRMACAKCDFYMPKDSTAALLLEGRTHCDCSKRFRSARRSRPRSRMAWRPTKTFYRSYRMCPRLQAQRCVSSAPGWSRSHLFGRHCQLRPLRTREVTALEVESGLIHAIRVESELQLTIRELRSRGSGASLDVPESSMLPKTLFPGA